MPLQIMRARRYMPKTDSLKSGCYDARIKHAREDESEVDKPNRSESKDKTKLGSWVWVPGKTRGQHARHTRGASCVPGSLRSLNLHCSNAYLNLSKLLQKTFDQARGEIQEQNHVRPSKKRNHASYYKICKLRQNRHTEIKRYVDLFDTMTLKERTRSIGLEQSAESGDFGRPFPKRLA